ncbi:MAG: PilZ domain-containing protein [Sandaracinus sp.]|nr:PilZ domain-containing protein [Sandaracinus sp.]
MGADELHFRRGGRQPVRLRIRFRVGAALEQEGTTNDVSMGGAFVETRRPPSVGQTVELELVSPTAWDPLKIPALVRWSSDGSDGRAIGFGVRFDELTRGQASALHELLQASGYLEEGA